MLAATGTEQALEKGRAKYVVENVDYKAVTTHLAPIL